ncbi:MULTISPECIES: helix-turn-helix transcriptional regulator [unclassified Streptomyces]|uniref:helix-turn-helix domain-containing protein n=1 Tax=unclassified Streptomyces TaxID=2593676 RepID=UPI001F10A06A|nr:MULTISPECIES: helix-turn-helix transcriptional regulator [unclassified Streptomyces]
MTKKDVAAQLGVTPAAVGQYETGASRPRPDLIPACGDPRGSGYVLPAGKAG